MTLWFALEFLIKLKEIGSVNPLPAESIHTCGAGGMQWVPRLLASTAPVQAPGHLVDTVDDTHVGRTLLITGGLGALGVLFAVHGLHQVW